MALEAVLPALHEFVTRKGSVTLAETAGLAARLMEEPALTDNPAFHRTLVASLGRPEFALTLTTRDGSELVSSCG
jgi:hypothetical protein